MKHSRTSSVSDVGHLDPLMVEVLNSHLLLKLTCWTRRHAHGLHVVEAHATPTAKQLHTMYMHNTVVWHDLKTGSSNNLDRTSNTVL